MTRDPSPIRGEVIRQGRALRPAVAGAANPLERDLRARLRHAVGDELRMAEYDAEAAGGLCDGECSTAPGSTRGGRLLGDGTVTAGVLACDERGDPLTEFPGPEALPVFTRPCIDCNEPRYRAWLFGRLSGDRKRKRESGPVDRAAQAEKQRRDGERAFI